MGPLRADAIFADMSREFYKNRATLAKKVREMACSEVSNKTVTLTAASNALEKIGIKVIFSTLHRDSQRPAYAPLPPHGHPPFFLEEAEVNMANVVFAMRLLKACVTRHEIMAMANSMHKGTPTANIFNKESVSVG